MRRHGLSEGISQQDAPSFRLEADECREQFERATNPLDKEQWLRLSGAWTKMAQNAERRCLKPGLSSGGLIISLLLLGTASANALRNRRNPPG
jgi:hypothetical protein